MENVGLLTLVFFVSLAVSLGSTLVGGRGSIMVPFLLFLGFPAQQAIATNRLATLSNLPALLQFHKQGAVQWKLGLFLGVFAGLGSTIGSFLVLQLDSEIIEKGIGIIILLSLPMFFLDRQAGLKERKKKLTKAKQTGGAFIMTFLGMLGGFFATTGVWFSYVYIFYYGLTFIQRAATGKIAGFFMIVSSLAVFIPAGVIQWPAAISMLAGGSVGSWISAKYATRLGNQTIRYLFLALMMFMALKILLF